MPRKNPSEPLVMETFRPPYSEISSLRRDEPACFNGMVHVQRYRITVELIDEPKEVLQERLEALMAQTTRLNSKKDIELEAKRLGIELS
jgi:hypothetical protein